jgi:hypothetical protein
LNDFDEAVRAGTLEVDGKIIVPTPTEWINQNKAASAAAKTGRAEDDEAAKKVANAGFDAGVELNVSKAAVEPVWYLPGIAERCAFSLHRCFFPFPFLRTDCPLRTPSRFNISEGVLRRALFEDTGGACSSLL